MFQEVRSLVDGPGSRCLMSGVLDLRFLLIHFLFALPLIGGCEVELRPQTSIRDGEPPVLSSPIGEADEVRVIQMDAVAETLLAPNPVWDVRCPSGSCLPSPLTFGEAPEDAVTIVESPAVLAPGNYTVLVRFYSEDEEAEDLFLDNHFTLEEELELEREPEPHVFELLGEVLFGAPL